MYKKNRELLIFYIILITITVIGLPLIIREIVSEIKFDPIYKGEFTPEAWEMYPDLRHYMIKDMEKKLDIFNLTYDEIIGILGTNESHSFPPAEGRNGAITYRITEYDRYVGTFLVYHIVISENKRVEEIYRARHSGGGW
ncbi:MAG: hypothetical protein LBL09_04685 [Oscillospiraceae bacterium]|jgi:hypothetical protein|nr:hypothetical protein [Oscillospiraceae bacterium]